MKSLRSLIFLISATLVAGLAPAAPRLKDITHIDGVRRNQLIGYGLVVGLSGTGDKAGSEFTNRATSNLLERLGMNVSPDDIKLKNVAAVILTADLPPFARAGQRIDVTVSSLGDSPSLQGGTLLLTPLRAANGEVYAVAQGSVIIGGMVAVGAGGGVQVNHATVGRIPSGALLERDSPTAAMPEEYVDLVIEKPDFTTAARVAAALDERFGEGASAALDAGRVRVRIPEEYLNNRVPFMAEMEVVTVKPDATAKVVLDEKTGTIVVGQNVAIRPVAIGHGSLTIQIKPYLEVSQAQPLAPGGETVARDRTEISVSEGSGKLAVMGGETDLASLVRALNALGVGPRDLVTIFQTLKAAGALEAELEIL